MTFLFHKRLSDITLDDLRSLRGLSEPSRYDLKREITLDRKGKKELAKDVSAFANGQGGLLIIGADESAANEADFLVPCTVDRESVSRVINSALSPRPIFDTRDIALDGGGHVFIVRVEPTVFPCQVTAYGDRRFYRRSGAENVPLNEHELRDRYLRAKHHASQRDEKVETLGQRNLLSLIAIPLLESTISPSVNLTETDNYTKLSNAAKRRVESLQPRLNGYVGDYTRLTRAGDIVVQVPFHENDLSADRLYDMAKIFLELRRFFETELPLIGPYTLHWRFQTPMNYRIAGADSTLFPGSLSGQSGNPRFDLSGEYSLTTTNAASITLPALNYLAQGMGAYSLKDLGEQSASDNLSNLAKTLENESR